MGYDIVKFTPSYCENCERCEAPLYVEERKGKRKC